MYCIECYMTLLIYNPEMIFVIFVNFDRFLFLLIPWRKAGGILGMPFVRHSVRNTFVSAPYLLNPLNDFY